MPVSTTRYLTDDETEVQDLLQDAVLHALRGFSTSRAETVFRALFPAGARERVPDQSRSLWRVLIFALEQPFTAIARTVDRGGRLEPTHPVLSGRVAE